MSQLTFTDAEQDRVGRRTRRERFLAEMETVVPWRRLEALIEPAFPKGKRGRRPYPLSAMLRCYLMQNWFGFSDPGMEDALYEVNSIRRFAGLDMSALPDETTLLKFRHLLERHKLTQALFEEVRGYLEEKNLMMREGSMIDATIIHAPSSTKNATRTRDPEMHSTRKGNQWYFGMKAHIGVDDESGLVHTVETTAANAADVTMAQELLHGEETRVWADAGYTGADKKDPEDRENPRWWCIAAKRGTISKLPDGEHKSALKALETLKARVRARVEHAFRVLKCQFGFRKVRYKGLAKNKAQLMTLFALGNLYVVRRRLMAPTG